MMLRNSFFFIYCVLNIISVVLVASYSPKDPKPPKKKGSSLRLLFSLGRHGDRTQEKFPYKVDDPSQNLTYFPYNYEQMTNTGIRRAFKLGQILRKNYGHFLGPLYYGGIVQARTTEYERCKASLLSTLAGLFPPHPINVWSKEDELANFWTPIPFLYPSISNDTIFWGLYCPNYNKLYDEYKLTPEHQATLAKYQGLLDYINKYTALNFDDYTQIRYIFFTLTFQEDYGLTLPEWTKAIYKDKLVDAVVDGYYANAATPQMRKYLAGFFFKEMIGEIKKKIAGTLDKGRKIYVYTAHEINIAFSMITLGIMYHHYPKLCENLTFELHEIKKEYYIRILHQEFVTEKPKAVRIPGCTEYCPFEKFENYLSGSIPGPEDTCYDNTTCSFPNI